MNDIQITQKKSVDDMMIELRELNCALLVAEKLYQKRNQMLGNFMVSISSIDSEEMIVELLESRGFKVAQEKTLNAKLKIRELELERSILILEIQIKAGL